jgi:metal-dependent amidase/aminoacylase/carboxypeptidase family protein
MTTPAPDLAAFLCHRPGAFILKGAGTEGANAMPLHNPGYDFNDAALAPGVAYWVELARS